LIGPLDVHIIIIFDLEEARERQLWLFLQAERHFSAAFDLLNQQQEPCSLPCIPSATSAPPSSLAKEISVFFASLTQRPCSTTTNWVGGHWKEKEVLELLYNWANLRREWAMCLPLRPRSVANEENSRPIVTDPRVLMLKASLALYQLCSPFIQRLAAATGRDNREELKKAVSATDAKEHRQLMAGVMANWGVALVELGRVSATTATGSDHQRFPCAKEWWDKAKGKFRASEQLSPGIGINAFSVQTTCHIKLLTVSLQVPTIWPALPPWPVMLKRVGSGLNAVRGKQHRSLLCWPH